jgi:hypothetical protein
VPTKPRPRQAFGMALILKRGNSHVQYLCIKEIKSSSVKPKLSKYCEVLSDFLRGSAKQISFSFKTKHHIKNLYRGLKWELFELLMIAIKTIALT